LSENYTIGQIIVIFAKDRQIIDFLGSNISYILSGSPGEPCINREEFAIENPQIMAHNTIIFFENLQMFLRLSCFS